MYSKSAIDQLTKITRSRGLLLYFRCPYQARVMKIFEMISKTTVFSMKIRLRSYNTVTIDARSIFSGTILESGIFTVLPTVAKKCAILPTDTGDAVKSC